MLVTGTAAVIGVFVLGVISLLGWRWTGNGWMFANLRLLVLVWTLAAVGVAGAWSAWSIRRSQGLTLSRLKARRVPKGELMDTKGALKDMGLAAGIDPAPEPWVMETGAVNAVVLVARKRRPIVVVTRGLLRQPLDVQRAVFANLTARILTGDAEWATAGAALMGPIFAMRDRDISGEDDDLPGAAASAKGDQDAPAPLGETADDLAAALLFGLVLYIPLVLLTEVLAQYFRWQAVAAAEAADADGMLLLKDPAAMMEALIEVLPARNLLPVSAGPLGALAYAWPGWEDAPGDGGLEIVRIARMREVLGAEGIEVPSDIARRASAMIENGTRP